MSDKPAIPPRIDESAIAEQAARWHAVLETAGPRELTELAAWLKMSPRHGHHFLYATAVDRLLHRIDPDKTRFDPHAWVRESRGNVVPLEPMTGAPGNGAPARKRRAFLLSAAAAGAAAVLIAGGWLASVRAGWEEFRTRTGEQRTVELEDGSIVHLNTGTEVRVRLTATARDIRLVEGEALFKVHRDPTRPFRVHTPGNVIQAVGTQFNVHRRSDVIRVSVLEGAVRITDAGIPDPAASTSLTAGQEADIRPDGSVSRHAEADVADTVAWRQRRLVFHAEALAEMVTEFNRYNRALKFRLEGIDGYARHYTGTFDADDPESFATVLSQEAVYGIDHRPGEIVIRKR